MRNITLYGQSNNAIPLIKLLSEGDCNLSWILSSQDKIKVKQHPNYEDIVEEISIFDENQPVPNCQLIIVLKSEEEINSSDTLRDIENLISPTTLIAIPIIANNLSVVQNKLVHPLRLIGLNWSFPCDTNDFLEIIGNNKTNRNHLVHIKNFSKSFWKKDSYIISSGISIQGRLFAAILREALFLVENEYSSIQGIDRACRNDPGYYLPYIGNFRYMDITGPYAYGLVMEDLNKELCNSITVSPVFTKKITKKHYGMNWNQGFYKYSSGDFDQWYKIFKTFSKDLSALKANFSSI